MKPNWLWFLLIPVLVWLVFMLVCGIVWCYWIKGQNSKAEKIFVRSLLVFAVISFLGWICFGLKYRVWF